MTPPIKSPSSSLIDYGKLSEQLMIAYTKDVLQRNLQKFHGEQHRQQFKQLLNQPVIKSIHSLSGIIVRYRHNNSELDKALDTIDLPKIFERLEIREKTNKDKNLDYDDLLVLELLNYFKNDFFKWVNSPDCPSCGSNEDVQGLGAINPSSSSSISQSQAMIDQVSVIEVHECKKCKQKIEFPRINNPVTLLTTRRGRCGEWVNCFMLILQALIGGGDDDSDRIRYVWNQEDHVWCEYYSLSSKRWIHLDPCEGVYDEPLLYCNNWGKRMSYVIGFNYNYMIDLSDKYIVPEKQIPKNSIVNVQNVNFVISYLNGINQLKHFKRIEQQQQQQEVDVNEQRNLAFLKLYRNFLVPYNKEINQLKPELTKTTPSTDLPLGRQSGSTEWTKSRGENGES